MSMNPRLLKPTASGFTPRSISGLALWLDASSSDLYTTDAGPVVAVASPLDIAGCVGWWDASDAASITASSGLVSQWNDKSGNNRHATASGSLRPTSGGSQNGRTVMQFTGTQAMTITGNFLQSDNVTMFAVAMKNTDHYGGIITSAPGNPEDSPVLCFYLTTIAWLNRRVLVQQATGNGVYRIVSGQSSGTSQFGWFDGNRGTDTGTATPTNTTNTITKIGALRTSSTADLNGNIAEIVCYSGNLSTAQRASVEAYLAAKWSISGVHAPATASSDPVGYWGDKSGNGRHVTQSASGSRPTISASPQNGRNALAFNGSSQSLSIASYNAENGLPGLTRYIVASMSSAQPTLITRVWSGGGDSIFGTVSGEVRFYAGSAYSAVASANYGLLTSGTNIIGSVYDGTAGSVAAGIKPYYNGAAIPPSSTTGTLPTALPSGTPGFWIGSNIGVNSFWPGRIIEYISYSRALGTADRQRLERYLSAKYGITLAPTVSNADAQDWINRVYSNGGTVSSATAGAVNQLCDSLDAASLRDRFYRLNLFCGSNLNAALVPLYRGPSLGGTQYGGTTDTNNAFVGIGTDYAETGATGGLLGNGTTKYLNTGFNVDQLPGAANCHLSSFITGTQDITSVRTLVGTIFNSVTDRYRLFLRTDSSTPPNYTLQIDLGKSEGASQINRTNTSGGLLVGSRTSTTNLSLYAGGVSAAAPNTNPTAETTGASPFFVFARNGPTEYYNGRMAAYSIGAGMTAAQVTAYNTAIQAFQTAMGRV